jgi:hypothetical protein
MFPTCRKNFSPFQLRLAAGNIILLQDRCQTLISLLRSISQKSARPKGKKLRQTMCHLMGKCVVSRKAEMVIADSSGDSGELPVRRLDLAFATIQNRKVRIDRTLETTGILPTIADGRSVHAPEGTNAA